MGIMRQASNTKIPATKSKKWRKHRIRRAERVKKEGRVTGVVEDAELTTSHHLRKRRTSARANITLSGKKKRKLMKQLKHMQKDKEQMEVVEEVELSKKKGKKVRDTEMAEEDAVTQPEDNEPADEDDEMED